MKTKGKKKSGFFITLEGPEGSGKSTQLQKILSYFQTKKVSVIVLREPGATVVGEAIRNILLHLKVESMSPETELLLYLAARAQIVSEKILPALRKGQVVLCDRFEDSTLAYQGFGRGLPLDKILQASVLARGKLKPDLTLLLDIDPKLGFQRIKRGKDRMEKAPIAFHNRVRKGFLTLARRDRKRFCILDARQNPEEIFKRIHARLDHVFG